LFLSVLRHFENPKTYQPAREKNKQEKKQTNKIHADILLK
jgi:hypothetical protein